MTPQEFITKNQIDISDKTKLLCEIALNYMKTSLDIGHNETHIYRMIDSLDMMMKNEKSINWKEVEIEEILLAICWHDVWKSRRIAHSVYEFFRDMYLDGLGSRKMFLEDACKVDLDNDLKERVAYAVKKHSAIQFLPLRTVSSKILKDLDELELYSIERLNLQTEYYYKNRPSSKFNIWFVYHGLRFFLKYLKPQLFHYNWSREYLDTFCEEYMREHKKFKERYMV